MTLVMALAIPLLALLGSADCALARSQLMEQLLADDWIQYGESLYKTGSTDADWHTARTHCHEMHHLSDLTSLSSLGEHQFVVGQFGDGLWIGLNDIDSEGSYIWANGDQLGFTYWSPGEPNNSYDQDCGWISDLDAKWDDDQCEKSHAFVCEIEL